MSYIFINKNMFELLNKHCNKSNESVDEFQKCHSNLKNRTAFTFYSSEILHLEKFFQRLIRVTKKENNLSQN